MKKLSRLLALSTMYTSIACADYVTENERDDAMQAGKRYTTASAKIDPSLQYWLDYESATKNTDMSIAAYIAGISKLKPQAAMWFLITGGKYGFSRTPPSDADSKHLISAMNNVALYVAKEQQDNLNWKNPYEDYHKDGNNVRILYSIVNELQKKLDTIQKDIASQSSTITELNKEIGTLKLTVADQDKKINLLTITLATTEERLKTTEERLEATEKTLEYIKEQFSLQAAIIAQKQKESDEKTKELIAEMKANEKQRVEDEKIREEKYEAEKKERDRKYEAQRKEEDRKHEENLKLLREETEKRMRESEARSQAVAAELAQARAESEARNAKIDEKSDWIQKNYEKQLSAYTSIMAEQRSEHRSLLDSMFSAVGRKHEADLEAREKQRQEQLAAEEKQRQKELAEEKLKTAELNKIRDDKIDKLFAVVSDLSNAFSKLNSGTHTPLSSISGGTLTTSDLKKLARSLRKSDSNSRSRSSSIRSDDDYTYISSDRLDRSHRSHRSHRSDRLVAANS